MQSRYDKRKQDSRQANVSGRTSDDAGCLLLIIIGLLVWFLGPWSSEDKQVQELEKLTEAQNEQIETLKKSQQALENLVNYIQLERENAQIRSEELKADINRLRDLQKVDQEIVNKIFEEQQKQKEREKWTERIASFLIGIFSAWAFEFLKNRFIRHRNRNKKD